MDADYTPGQLRRMDEQQARETLTVKQFERWEKLQELDEEAAETKRDWSDQRETVTDLVVHADREALGTHVEIYGNDLLVRIHSENEQFREAAEGLNDAFGDEEEALEDLSVTEREDLAGHLLNMLDAVLLEWNGTPWDSVPKPDRFEILTRARNKWNLDGLLLAWFDIADTINDEREEHMDVVDSFRVERRGRDR